MPVSVALRKAVLFVNGERCFYCGRPADGIDHIDPRGGDGAANLTAACRPCNSSKGKRALNIETRNHAITYACDQEENVTEMAGIYEAAQKRAVGLIENGSLPLRQPIAAIA